MSEPRKFLDGKVTMHVGDCLKVLSATVLDLVRAHTGALRPVPEGRMR